MCVTVMDEVELGMLPESNSTERLLQMKRNNDAFRNVLLLLDHESPTNSSEYEEFVQKTEEYSSRDPFNVKESPFGDIDIYVSVLCDKAFL